VADEQHFDHGFHKPPKVSETLVNQGFAGFVDFWHFAINLHKSTLLHQQLV
jgi:hypothetical protein